MDHTTQLIDNDRLAGGLTAAIAVAAMAAANFIGVAGEDGGLMPFLVTTAITLLMVALVFGWAIPRYRDGAAGKAALVLAVLAVVTLIGYWSGIPEVLAPAAIVLGLAGRRHESGRGLATAAVVLGSVAYLVSLFASVAG
jgi:hypothetical protein